MFRHAGMNDHVAKPIEPDELVKVLCKWVEPSRRLESAGPISAHQADNGGLWLLPASLPGFDLPGAIARLGGNQRMLAKLLHAFVSDCASAGKELDNLLAGGNHDQAARLVHSIKGVSGNLGASELRATAELLQRQLESGSAEASVDFKSILKTSIEAISTCIPAVGAETSTPGYDPVATADMLTHLLGLLKEHRLVADSLETQVLSLLAGNVPNELLDTLTRQLGDLDYAGAMATTGAIAAVLDISLGDSG